MTKTWVYPDVTAAAIKAGWNEEEHSIELLNGDTGEWVRFDTVAELENATMAQIDFIGEGL